MGIPNSLVPNNLIVSRHSSETESKACAIPKFMVAIGNHGDI